MPSARLELLGVRPAALVELREPGGGVCVPERPLLLQLSSAAISAPPGSTRPRVRWRARRISTPSPGRRVRLARSCLPSVHLPGRSAGSPTVRSTAALTQTRSCAKRHHIGVQTVTHGAWLDVLTGDAPRALASLDALRESGRKRAARRLVRHRPRACLGAVDAGPARGRAADSRLGYRRADPGSVGAHAGLALARRRVLARTASMPAKSSTGRARGACRCSPSRPRKRAAAASVCRAALAPLRPAHRKGRRSRPLCWRNSDQQLILSLAGHPEPRERVGLTLGPGDSPRASPAHECRGRICQEARRPGKSLGTWLAPESKSRRGEADQAHGHHAEPVDAPAEGVVHVPALMNVQRSQGASSVSSRRGR